MYVTEPNTIAPPFGAGAKKGDNSVKMVGSRRKKIAENHDLYKNYEAYIFNTHTNENIIHWVDNNSNSMQGKSGFTRQ
jgi:hypothetical protein